MTEMPKYQLISRFSKLGSKLLNRMRLLGDLYLLEKAEEAAIFLLFHGSECLQGRGALPSGLSGGFLKKDCSVGLG